MTPLDPAAKCKPMKSIDMLDRIEFCKTMLYLHGFLSEAEKRKVTARIQKWIKKASPK